MTQTLDNLTIIAGKYIPKRTLLYVAFEEKEQVKKQGARWDSVEKRWFMANFSGLDGFNQYNNDSQTFNNFGLRVAEFINEQKIPITQLQNFMREAFSTEELKTIARVGKEKQVLCKDTQTLEQIMLIMIEILKEG